MAIFIKFKTLIKNQFNSHIHCLQYDNGGEFKAFVAFLVLCEIENCCSYLKISKQNDKAECKMRHIVETSFTLWAIASLPLKFWLYAFHISIVLINRMLTIVLQL